MAARLSAPRSSRAAAATMSESRFLMTGSSEKDDVNRVIQAALFVRVPLEMEGTIQAPVITLQGEQASVHHLFEKHLKADYVLGFERFWKVAKQTHDSSDCSKPWRPRVHGVQLKAFKCMRLPENEAEWTVVTDAVHSVAHCLRPDTTALDFVADLMKQAVWVRDWWAGRHPGAKAAQVRSSSKRAPTRSNSVQHSKRRALGFTPSASAPSDPTQMLVNSGQNGSGGAQQMALGGIPGVPNSGFPSRLVREDSGSGQLLSGFHPGATASQPSSGDPLMPMGLPGGHGSAGGLGTHGSGVNLNTATGPANASHLQTGLSTDDVQSLMAQMHEGSGGGGRRPGHRSEPSLHLLVHARHGGGGQQQGQQQGGLAPSAVLTPHQPPPQPATGSVSPSPSPGAQNDNNAAGDPLNQAHMVALLANLEQRIMTLNVGGLRYVTTAATLAAVENSFLWKLVFLAPPHNSPRTGQSGEFFIDRTNRVFDHVIEYLRTVRFSDAELPLPRGRADLALLLREANFYGLPGLSAKAQAALAGMADDDGGPLTVEVRVDNQGAVSVYRV